MVYYTKNEDGTFSEVPETPAVVEADQDQSDGPSDDDDFAYYVHLADGSVVKASERPVPGGTNSPLGHHVRDGYEYNVIGVYPRHNKVGE